MKEVDDLKRGIAEIVNQSHPGCGIKVECFTKCGECGAGRILSFLADKGACIQTEHGQIMIRDLLQ